MRNKRSPWDLSQMPSADRDELLHILNGRYNRRTESDGLDTGNEDLNGLRPGIYQDMSHPAPREPEIPADYAEHPARRLLKDLVVLALGVYILATAVLVLGKGYDNILLYAGLAVVVMLLGSIAKESR